MSYSGDAAEQVVRMTLEGTEVAAKITGAGAKEVAKLLYAVLRDQTKTKGKTRLANMLRTGKELKVFAVKDLAFIGSRASRSTYSRLMALIRPTSNADSSIFAGSRSTPSG